MISFPLFKKHIITLYFPIIADRSKNFKRKQRFILQSQEKILCFVDKHVMIKLISAASVTKLGKNENVNTEIIEKICVALQCDVSDIMEMANED